MYKYKKRGFTLLEILVATSIIATSLLGLVSVVGISFAVADEATQKIQASFLLEEGMEITRIMRDSGWTANIEILSEDTDYYFEFSDGEWRATSTNKFIDNLFERKFVIEGVYRDANDDITTSGGVSDAYTKKITVSVSWPGRRGTTTESISTYITNMFDS